MKLRSWDLSDDAFTALWDELPEEAFVLTARPDGPVLARRADAPGEPGDEGDAFTNGWHLRWLRLSTRVRVVAAGDVPGIEALPSPGSTLDLAGAVVERDEIVLWGTKAPVAKVGEADPYWIEARLPHLMEESEQHPAGLTPAQHPEKTLRRVLRIARYHDPATHAVLYTRYTDVRTLPEDEIQRLFKRAS